MAKAETMTVDIGVVGGGVTGLMLTQKLSRLGYRTALIEKGATLCSGPSVRNEGILHRGTRHAVATSDLDKAAKIVAKCQYGANQILQYAPESVANPDLKTFTAITPDEDIIAITDRWSELGVDYREVTLDQFARLVPEADISKITHVFQTADIPINVKILYQKLLADAERSGAQILLNSNFTAEDEQQGVIEDREGNITPVRAKLFVVTTGYGIAEVFSQATGEELPVRYWKSHLLVTPQLAQHGIMYVKDGEANITHQGNKTVSGQWGDGVLVDQPDTIPMQERVSEVFSAVERTLPGIADHKDNYMVVACVKPDIERMTNQGRSVDEEILEPTPGYLFALPGKMTEAPYVADKIARKVCQEYPNPKISQRPLDIFDPSQKRG